MKHLTFFLLVAISYISCDKQGAIVANESNLSCSKGEISFLEGFDCCELNPAPDACEIVNDESINYISEESFDWLPDICTEIGSKITFGQGTEKTEFIIKNKSHYIIKERLFTSCNGVFGMGTYIIQQNEFVSVAVVNELFGNGPIQMELKTSILTYMDNEPGPTLDAFRMHQPDKNIDISNLNFSYDIGSRPSNTLFRVFHETIEINSVEYHSVIEFKSIGSSTSPPDAKFYINADFGLFAFEKDDIIWVRTK